MITTIFLDLDDTLFSFQQAEQVALEETMRHYTLPYSDEILALYSAGNDAQWKLLEQGKVQRSEIGYRRFDLLLTHLGSDLDREEVNHYYMERLSSRHFFLPGAEELLSALHERYTLCLASNGTGWVQEGRLKSSGILPLLDRVFISEYLGANKPQLGFFDACFASLPGVKRSENRHGGRQSDLRYAGRQNRRYAHLLVQPEPPAPPHRRHRRIPDPPPTGSAPLAGEAVILHNLQE